MALPGEATPGVQEEVVPSPPSKTVREGTLLATAADMRIQARNMETDARSLENMAEDLRKRAEATRAAAENLLTEAGLD